MPYGRDTQLHRNGRRYALDPTAARALGGIGPFTLDGPMATIPYAPIFRRFADSGWVAVRVDKPGQGDSEGGDISELVFDDELAGYREALKLMLRAP